jgi:hypothetical protein
VSQPVIAVASAVDQAGEPVDKIAQMTRFENADAAAVIDTGNGLGVFQRRIHARGSIQKPSTRERSRFFGVAFVARKPIREPESFDGVTRTAERAGIGAAFAVRIHATVVADVGQAIGFFRIRPPVGREAKIIVFIAARRRPGFIHDRSRLEFEEAIRLDAQQGQSWCESLIARGQTCPRNDEPFRAKYDGARRFGGTRQDAPPQYSAAD